MPTPIKLGVIGAGSATFSVGVVKDICLQESLAGSTVVLMDIDGERLEPMLKFARRYAEELGADVTFEMALDREASLRDSDFVINTAQVGGHDFIEGIRAWAESHGYYRGFRLDACLNIRLMLSVARDMERLCPDAWLIQAGNPVFEGCTAMTRETGVKACGICHGHFGYLEIAETLGLDPDRVTAQAVGLNHWIYLTHFEHEGRDAYPLIDEWIEEKSGEFWSDYHPRFSDNQMAPAAIEIYKLTGLFPIGDATRSGGWWFHTGLDAKKKWYGAELGGFDSEIGWRQYLNHLDEEISRIHSAVEDSSRKLTDVFRPEPTGEQHFPLIDALVNDNRVELQVNVPNRGAIEGIPDDVVVEVPAMCSARGVQPYHVGKLPEALMTNVLYPRLLQAERLISLATRPDGRMLMAMILDDHRTRSWEHAVEFYEAILMRPEFGELTAEMEQRGERVQFAR
jgi:alpha-galactosidase